MRHWEDNGRGKRGWAIFFRKKEKVPGVFSRHLFSLDQEVVSGFADRSGDAVPALVSAATQLSLDRHVRGDAECDPTKRATPE